MPVDPRIQRLLDAPLSSRTDLRFASAKGCAQPPGTGPANTTCGSCRHLTPMSSDYRQWYCEAVPRACGDRGHIIRKDTAACGRWERATR